jgi:hypothetical protein
LIFDGLKSIPKIRKGIEGTHMAHNQSTNYTLWQIGLIQ